MREKRRASHKRSGGLLSNARILLFMLALIAGVLFAADRGEAVIRLVLKNNSYEEITVAVNYRTAGGRWITRGWWRILPGDTAEPDVNTDNSYFYFYAEGDDGGIWNGDDDPDGITRWVVSDKFNHYDDSPNRPKGRDLRQASFFMSQASDNYLMQSFSD